MLPGSYRPNSVNAPKRTSNTSNYSNQSEQTVMTISANSPHTSSSSGGVGIGDAAGGVALLSKVATGLATMGPAGWTILGVGVVIGVGVAIVVHHENSHT